jgi:uncharacterized repeat protein (TIGR03847 family)
MARRLFIFDGPDRFLAGAVGSPGGRAFYLQARKGDAVVSVGIEKVQVAALAARLDDLLAAIEAPEPPMAQAGLGAGLEQPIVESFRVGALALAWDAADEAVVIEAQRPTEDGEYVEAADEDAEGPDLLRVRIGSGAAREFVRAAQALVEAGRPACPFCGEPLDAIGHFCARSTGNGRVT